MEIWRIFYPVLLYFAGCLAGGIFLPANLSMIVGAGLVFPLFLREKMPIRMKKGQKKDLVLLAFLGASAALFFNILFSLLTITQRSAQYTQVAEKQFSYPLGVGILLYGVISPLAEEILFRGIVYNRMKKIGGSSIAILGSALLFGLYHGNAVQALYAFLLGSLIAFFYDKYDSFAAPVFLHSAANISVYVVSDSPLCQTILMNWTGCAVCGTILLVLCVIAEKICERKE